MSITGGGGPFAAGKEDVGLLQNANLRQSIYLEKVFKNFRQKLNRSENEQILLDQKTCVLIWRLLVSTPMKAAVHLG